MEKRFELIATLDGQVVARSSSVDIDDVIADADHLEEQVNAKQDEILAEAYPVFQEER